MAREEKRTFGFNRKVVMLSAARMADAFDNSLLIVLLPLYVVRIPKTPFFARFPDETLIGFLISLAGLLFALMQPAAAALSDRTGRRKPFILAGLAVLGLSTIGYIFVHTYHGLVGLRALQGFGIAFTIPTALALISEYSEKGRVGGSMGVFTTARMTGFALGPLVGGILMVRVSFQAAFAVGAAGAFLSLVLVLLFVPEMRGERARAREPGGATGSWKQEASDVAEANPSPSARDLDRWGNDRRKVRWVMRQLYVLGLCVFTMALSVSLIASVEPELNDRLGQTAVGFGLAFSMLTLGRLIFQIPIGNLSDRIGRRRLIFGGLILLGPLTFFQGIAPSTTWLSMDRFLLGVATAMIIAPAYAMVADRGLRGLRVRQMSIMTMSFGLGIATGPLLSGALAGTLGFESPFLVGAALSVIAALCFYLGVAESNPPEVRMRSGDYL